MGTASRGPVQRPDGQIVTSELIGSDHGAAFVTPNTDYVVETTQYAVPLGGGYADPAKEAGQ